MTLEQKLTRARQLRKAAMIAAETLDDAKAAELPTLYPTWKSGEAVEVDDRRYYEPDGRLYKCRQAHTTQADWTPDVTPAMWAVIDVTHAGTMDDPIPAKPNMRYYPGKYYLDGGRVYKCTRDTEQAIAQLPHELVGVYFEEAE